MAKKVVATLKTGAGKAHTKCIKMVKSEKTGAYSFKTEVVLNDQIKDFFAIFRLITKSFLTVRSFLYFCRAHPPSLPGPMHIIK